VRGQQERPDGPAPPRPTATVRLRHPEGPGARAGAGALQEPQAGAAGPSGRLDWDQYQSIGYRQDHALWADQPGKYQAKFFHLGLYFHSPVRMYDVVDGMAQELAYDGAAFDHGRAASRTASCRPTSALPVSA
jgi:glucans biosynthesis protein